MDDTAEDDSADAGCVPAKTFVHNLLTGGRRVCTVPFMHTHDTRHKGHTMRNLAAGLIGADVVYRIAVRPRVRRAIGWAA